MRRDDLTTRKPDCRQAGVAAAGPSQGDSWAFDVSLVVTSYNHAHFLVDALDSIMAQTARPGEVIVVDDGSRDDPAAVVAKYPGVRLIVQHNQGRPRRATPAGGLRGAATWSSSMRTTG